MKTFKNLGLAEPILNTLLKAGYESPTPIQAQAIPTMIEGRDVMGIAQTGTGKTAAFVLPQLHFMVQSPKAPAAKSATVLILTPTRELAAQIADSIRTYGRAVTPSVAIVIGGVKPGPQIKTMRGGVNFLVATPGRLLDHMRSGAINLAGVRSVVVDEADQMLDLGFIPAIRKIMRDIPARRQTLLFSATMPTAIQKLASDFLNNPVHISVAPGSKPIERIDQKVVFVEKPGKTRLLSRLLKDEAVGRAIVFARTKHGASRLCQHLGRVGIEAEPIHGDRSQRQRERTLSAFRNGKLSILVATDIAARGIDIDDVSHVYNYDLPNVPEAYIHRIGRTARAGKSGQAIAFCDGSERKLLRAIEKLTGMNIPVLENVVVDTDLPIRKPEEAGHQARENTRRNSRGKPAGADGERRRFRRRAGRKAKNGESANEAPATARKSGSPKNRKRRRHKPAASVAHA